MENINIGILGAGDIAHKMADTVCRMDHAKLYAVASRSLEKAEKFAEQYGVSKFYAGYDELTSDKNVDLIYVATPHSLHYEHVKLCLEHGKNVLVEKPFMINSAQAREVIQIAREKKLLLAEAMWTRYMPSCAMICEIMTSGMIGKVSSLVVNLGYAILQKERIQRSELGGGALMDLGVYPISYALMLFGNNYTDISTDVVFSERKVDLSNSVTLKWPDGKMAVLHSSVEASTDCRAVISGDKGYIVADGFINCKEIQVYNTERQLIRRQEIPKQISGYEYEVEACRKALEKGDIECEDMTHTDTLCVMELTDKIRNIWGMRFACE